MPHPVLLTRDAAEDLAEIAAFLRRQDGDARAEHVVDRIAAALDDLAALPHRGACPPELAAVGITEYQGIFFKPYRLIYRVLDRQVHVLVIADGRRDMRALLQRRLLGA